MKRYEIRCPYCGATSKKIEVLLKINVLFKDYYYHTCSVCHHQSTWWNKFHLRHDSTSKKEKEANKGKLFDDRIR